MNLIFTDQPLNSSICYLEIVKSQIADFKYVYFDTHGYIVYFEGRERIFSLDTPISVVKQSLLPEVFDSKDLKIYVSQRIRYNKRVQLILDKLKLHAGTGDNELKLSIVYYTGESEMLTQMGIKLSVADISSLQLIDDRLNSGSQLRVGVFAPSLKDRDTLLDLIFKFPQHDFFIHLLDSDLLSKYTAHYFTYLNAYIGSSLTISKVDSISDKYNILIIDSEILADLPLHYYVNRNQNLKSKSLYFSLLN